jgi:Periplasmic binding protein domain
MAMGAAQAVMASGQHKIIVGFDGNPDAIQLIKKGFISATVQYPTHEMGVLAIKNADQAIRTDRIDGSRVQTVPCTIYPVMELPTIAKPHKDPAFEAVAFGLRDDLNYLLEEYKKPGFDDLHQNAKQYDFLEGLVQNASNNTDTIINAEAKTAYSKQYIASLSSNRTGFSRYAEDARTNSRIKQETIGLLENGAKGLELKASCAFFGGDSDVMVTAKTIRIINGEKKEFSGYYIYYNHITDPPVNRVSFNAQNSPTDPQPIPPDRWVLWAEKDGKVSPTKTCEFGEHKSVTVELEAVE